MSIEVYGIPNCGTCKKAIAWLKSNGVAYEFIDTKEHPPDKSTIQSWVEDLGSKPMRNTSGKSCRAIGEERNSWSDLQWIEAFAEDAMLLKRPLFVKDKRAVMAGFKASEAEIKDKLGV